MHQDTPSRPTTFDAQKAIEHLQALLRIDTSNPPGRERAAALYLAGLLETGGIRSTIIESAPSRANLIARVQGSGGARPLLLAAHLDVVPADASRWKHPPFAGEIHDGWLWGRGALDMKNMAVMAALILLQLKKDGLKLERDVIFAAVADEEAGCDLGSRYLVEHHPDLVRAEYMVGEVGGYTLHLNGRRYYPVQVAEKGVCWIRMTVSGTPGHGSIPHADNPVVKLGLLLQKLGSTPLPQHTTQPVARFIRAVAPNQPVPVRYVLPLLLQPSFSPIILNRLMPDRSVADSFRALLHNTVSPTVLEAGTNINMIPGEASVMLDGRTLPGQTTETILDEIRQILGSGVDIKLTVVREMPPVETSAESPLFETIREVVREYDPEALTVPYIIPGYTDAKYFSQLGMRCYGFSPVKFPPGSAFGKLFHGNDERIPVDGFLWGLEVLYDVVQRFVSS